MKKKILLTGASGFVGSNFLARYSKNFNIKSVSLRDNAPDSISYEGFDCVVHCAALVHQMKGAPKQEYFQINYELTKKLADRAKTDGVKHFIFLSSAHVFGDSGNLYNHEKTLSEISECIPHDAYGKSKLAAEKYLLSIQGPSFTVSLIRPPMVYGKGAKGNIITLAKLIKVWPLLPFAYTLNKRSIVFVGNLCQFIALTIEKKIPGILLPQDPSPVSIGYLVAEIAHALKVSPILFNIPNILMKIIFRIIPKASVRLFGSLAFDSTRTNERLGYTPFFSTREGLKEMFSNDSHQT
ncbi:MAG: NAD-dependent epimerase/dehydratase family protein [Bdellovibrio sp.]